MARIPRSEQSESFKPAMQPFSSGDGYEAPGRAMQKLGQGIAAVGQGIASLQGAVDQDDEFKAKLAMLRLSNEQDLDDMQSQSSFNPDRDDVDQYTAGRVQRFQERAGSAIAGIKTPRAQRNAMLHIERMRGSVQERATRFQTGQKQQQLYRGAETAITGEFERLGSFQPVEPSPDAENQAGGYYGEAGVKPATPDAGEQYMQRFETTLRSAEAIIQDMPTTPQVKQQLSKHAAALAMAALGRKQDAWPSVEAWLKRQQEAMPAPGPGPQSSAQTPNGNWRIYDQHTPTASERRQIAQGGGVVVNLDTNWAKGDRPTTPMVVIPDNASAEQRAAAQEYAAGVSRMYRDKFGVDLKPRVVTRSQNGRGRNDTIHTEPFSVNDTRAVDYFTGDEGRKAHAELLRQTFGKVPGVVFSLPHDPTRRGDNGAVGPRGSEVDIARKLLAELKGAAALGGPVQTASAPAAVSTDASQTAVSPIRGTVTAYSPQAAGSKMEGGYAAARPGPDGKAEVRTIDDFVSGRSPYVTVAGNPSLNGKRYTIPSLPYIDAEGKQQVLTNVPVVVHDTGSAFKTAPEGRFDIPIARDANNQRMEANHAAWRKAGVEFMPGDGKAPQVAGSEQRAMNAIPGTPVRVAQASGVRAELSEIMLKAMPAMREAYRKRVEGMVGQIEDMASKGYEVPDQVIERTAADVSKTGDGALSNRMEMLSTIVRNSRATNQANPAELSQVIQRMEAQAMAGPATPQQIAAIEHFKKKRSEIEAALKKDPYELGVRTGQLAAVPPIKPDASPEEMKAALDARVAARSTLQGRYRQELPFFNPKEVQEFTEYMAQAKVPIEVRLGALRVMYDSFGPEMPKAMREIAKDAPELAVVGWLQANNADPMAMKDAMRGLDLRRTEGFKSRLPSGDEVLKATDTITGIGNGAFVEVPEAKQYAMTVAKLIYEARAERKGLDPKAMTVDADLWKQAVQEAMGRNMGADGKVSYGGVSTMSTNMIGFGGTKVFVPPWIKTDGGLDEVMGKLRMSDLVPMSPAKAAAAAAGREDDLGSVTVPATKGDQPVIVDEAGVGPAQAYEVLQRPGVESVAMPGTPSGKPAPIAEVKSAQLVWIGGSRYLLRKGFKPNGEPEYIGVRGAELNYVLDLEKLRPALENRVAKDTFRALR